MIGYAELFMSNLHQNYIKMISLGSAFQKQNKREGECNWANHKKYLKTITEVRKVHQENYNGEKKCYFKIDVIEVNNEDFFWNLQPYAKYKFVFKIF